MIAGYAELLGVRSDEHTRREASARIGEAAERLSEAIEHLLELVGSVRAAEALHAVGSRNPLP